MNATPVVRALSRPEAAVWPLGAAALALALLGIGASFAGAGIERVWVLVMLAPLLEESVFRAGVQEALLRRNWRPLTANGLTALAFALAHVAVRGEASAFAVVAPALLVGAVYGRWRRLRWCVALHAAMNALWLVWAVWP